MAGPVELPGSEAAQVALNEVVVHGWDLAVATGQPYAADPASVDDSASSSPALLDAGDRGPARRRLRHRRRGARGRAGAHRLLGMMGRRADWRAPHAVS